MTLQQFQAAFRELVDLLADSYDGHPDVEYVDTFMYGFWGEGHTWPLEKNPFPDSVTAENTFVSMFQHQLERWKKTPMAHEHAAGFQQGRQLGTAGPHGAQLQLAADGHDLHRERAD